MTGPRTLAALTIGAVLLASPAWSAQLVVVEARGSNMPKTASFYHSAGTVTALRIDGKKVTNAGEINVGGLPEAVSFSPDGQYLYVGNFMDGDLWVLHVEGSKLTDTTQRIKLPGHPASMRSGPQ